MSLFCKLFPAILFPASTLHFKFHFKVHNKSYDRNYFMCLWFIFRLVHTDEVSIAEMLLKSIRNNDLDNYLCRIRVLISSHPKLLPSTSTTFGWRRMIIRKKQSNLENTLLDFTLTTPQMILENWCCFLPLKIYLTFSYFIKVSKFTMLEPTQKVFSQK